MTNVKKLTQKIVAFRNARDWKQFHNPNEVSISLALEAAELHAFIRAKNKPRNKARMVAGYCWKWISKKAPALKDMVLPGYIATWNLTVDGQAWTVRTV